MTSEKSSPPTCRGPREEEVDLMRRLLQKIGEWVRELRKDADALLDYFRPRGWVEIRLIHATGPKKGEIARSEKFPMRRMVWPECGHGVRPQPCRACLLRA